MKLASMAAVIGFACISLSSAFAQTQGPLSRQETNQQSQVTFKPDKFGHSSIIDNTWMPMKPGTRWIYEGTNIEEDGKTVPHRIVITITELAKRLSGILTVVSYDLDYSDGELVEAELAFYAQDDAGNVWQFGEYPEEYEDGKFVKAPAWVHGLKGARAGIAMPAVPQLGGKEFTEGLGPAVGWKDRGIVYQVGQKVSVPAGVFENVLVIKEGAAGERDAEQLKYYAPGTGNIRTGWLGSNASVTESLELIRIEHLSSDELHEVNRKALRLEANAYNRSKDVYAKTARSIVKHGHSVTSE
jgi:hypothetical protein